MLIKKYAFSKPCLHSQSHSQPHTHTHTQTSSTLQNSQCTLRLRRWNIIGGGGCCSRANCASHLNWAPSWFLPKRTVMVEDTFTGDLIPLMSHSTLFWWGQPVTRRLPGRRETGNRPYIDLHTHSVDWQTYKWVWGQSTHVIKFGVAKKIRMFFTNWFTFLSLW